MSFRLEWLRPEERDALIRNDFAFFAQAMFAEVTPGVELIWAPYLDLFCAWLADLAFGRRRKLIVTLPPRHLKSFLVSVALPAFILGHDPTAQIMCVSYGLDLAKTFGAMTQTLMRSELYVRLFGDLLGRRLQPTHHIRTIRGGVRRATSIDGVATGFGAGVMIFDDPQKADEAISDPVRERTNEAYRTTFLSRSNDPATHRIVIVMQRLHENDFVASVQETDPAFELLNLPAIAEEDEAYRYETCMGSGAFVRKAGEALHPRRIPLEELAKVRLASGERIWETQYLQRPTSAGGGIVKTSWFPRYRPGDQPAYFDRVVQSWDCANTVAQGSDYSVCTTWGVKAPNVYLLDVFRDRLIFPDLKRKVLALAVRHNATIVYIEESASGTQLLQDLRDEGHGQFHAVKPTGEKQIRMANQTAMIEAGRVHLPVEADWLPVYLHELEMFPRGRHDDQVDSTSQALANMFQFSGGAGFLEYVRQEKEREKRKEEEIWVLRPPPGHGQLIDSEGKLHLLKPDGCFHLPRRHALPNVNQIGWTLVERRPGPVDQ